jgi:clathrin heavy chain
VQHDDIPSVNEAINSLLIDDEDYHALRESIDGYQSFDQLALAHRCEGHELLEFRRIASHVYKLNGRFDRSIELSKADGLWQDAMETTAASQDRQLCEELVRYFIEEKNLENYTAALYTCYEHLHPDLILEWAWRHNLMTPSFPFFIQSFCSYRQRIETLEDRFARIDEEKAQQESIAKAASAAQQQTDAAYVGHHVGPYNPMLAPLALAAPPSNSNVQQFNPAMGGGQW